MPSKPNPRLLFNTINGPAHTTQVTVKGNHVHDNIGLGISVGARNPGSTVDHIRVIGNTVVSNGGSGVELFAVGPSGPGTTTDNLVKDNAATDNGGNGYQAGTNTVSNLFRGNRSNANGGFGYLNVSGPNTYQSNQCQFNASGSSNLPGVCEPQE